MRLAAVLLALGVITLVGLVALPAAEGESPWLAVAFRRRPLDGIVLAAGALAPVAIAGSAMAARSLARWQADLAIAGFALLFVKFRGWEHLRGLTEQPASVQLIVAASLAGTAVACVALVKAARG